MSSWHQRGSKACALLATGHASANEENALLRQSLAAAVRVQILRVATVNDNVALLEVGHL